MAERIIYRGRQRATKPYPFQVDVDAIPDEASYFLLGPLTLDELMEIKFRIRKFTAVGSVITSRTPTEEDPSTETTNSIDYELIRSDLSVRFLGEDGGGFFLMQSKTKAYEKESEFTNTFNNGFFDSYKNVFYKDTPEYILGTQVSNLNTSFAQPFKTDAGYYLPMIISVESNNSSFIGIYNTDRGEEEIGGRVYTNCQLKINSKTHTIRCRVYGFRVLSGSLTIEASEWWPYANADGQPIWNTADGNRTSNSFT
jgi:hypothetical protein